MRRRIKATLTACRHAVRYKNGPWSTGALAIIGGGAMLTVPETAIFGWISIGIGIGLLLWGVRINGMHLLQPWYLGKPSPFRVTAGVDNFDYAQGAVVSGIPWEQGFCHVYVTITNDSAEIVENVDAALAPEHPIIRSSARCAFAECRIGPFHGPLDVTFLVQYPDGTEIAEPHDTDLPGNYSFEPAHRLRCDKLPSGAVMKIDLATVVPDHSPTAPWFWNKTRTSPKGIRIRVHWTDDGGTYGVEHLLELKGINREERS